MTPTRWYHLVTLLIGILCVLLYDSIFLPELSERFYPKMVPPIMSGGTEVKPVPNRLSEALLSIPLYDRWLSKKEFSWTSGVEMQMTPTSWNYRIGVYFQIYVARILFIVFFISFFLGIAIEIIKKDPRTDVEYWPFNFAYNDEAVGNFCSNFFLAPGIIVTFGLASIIWVVTLPALAGASLLWIASCIRNELDVIKKEREKAKIEPERKTPRRPITVSRKASELSQIMAEIINKETGIKSDTCYEVFTDLPEKALAYLVDTITKPRTYRGLPVSEE